MENNHKAQSAPCCQICKTRDLKEVEQFSLLPRITSDCRSFEAGGQLFVCLNCGGVQKLPDARWLRETESIYSHYAAYYQSGGDEQIVFDRVTGSPRRRSDVILGRLLSEAQLKVSGRALDVGCGNGATLIAMSHALADWTFSGFELGDGTLGRLTCIPKFKKLFTGTLTAIDERFDLVTLVHVIEHFPAPVDALAQLLPAIGTGQIFIEVSNIEENPFDILVADHLMHFSPASLSNVVAQAGLTATRVSTEWVSKEISLLAKNCNPGENKCFQNPFLKSNIGHQTFERITTYVDWLQASVNRVRELVREKRSVGIFGTSIAATWLAGTVLDGIDFFVDEDPSRVGKEHRGKPILHPCKVPEHASVYFALVPPLAESIATRLKVHGFEKILPARIERD